MSVCGLVSAGGYGVRIQIKNIPLDQQIAQSRLFNRFVQRHFAQVRFAVGMPTQLKPASQLTMVGQQNALAKHIAMADAVISTAAIPGKAAPRIITPAMVESMKSGSVIVDLAAETGGNCELTRAGEVQNINGVTIIGPINLAAQLPVHASAMFSKNVLNFLKLFVKKEGFTLHFDDEILVATCVAGRG